MPSTSANRDTIAAEVACATAAQDTAKTPAKRPAVIVSLRTIVMFTASISLVTSLLYSGWMHQASCHLSTFGINILGSSTISWYSGFHERYQGTKNTARSNHLLQRS